MHQRLNPSRTKREHGITLIESLIALVVAALGVLGIVGVQMRTLADTQTSVRRAQAIQLIEDLGERMKVNPNSLASLSDYVTSFAAEPTVGSCAAGCDHTQLAAYDLAVWKRSVREALPLGQASIFIPPAETSIDDGQKRQLGVMIAWRENERDGTKTDDIDATKGTASGGAGTATTCPADHICHLQYIPVVGRCTPYVPGGNSPMYFCPGA